MNNAHDDPFRPSHHLSRKQQRLPLHVVRYLSPSPFSPLVPPSPLHRRGHPPFSTCLVPELYQTTLHVHVPAPILDAGSSTAFIDRFSYHLHHITQWYRHQRLGLDRGILGPLRLKKRQPSISSSCCPQARLGPTQPGKHRRPSNTSASPTAVAHPRGHSSGQHHHHHKIK